MSLRTMCFKTSSPIRLRTVVGLTPGRPRRRSGGQRFSEVSCGANKIHHGGNCGKLRLCIHILSLHSMRGGLCSIVRQLLKTFITVLTSAHFKLNPLDEIAHGKVNVSRCSRRPYYLHIGERRYFIGREVYCLGRIC